MFMLGLQDTLQSLIGRPKPAKGYVELVGVHNSQKSDGELTMREKFTT